MLHRDQESIQRVFAAQRLLAEGETPGEVVLTHPIRDWPNKPVTDAQAEHVPPAIKKVLPRSGKSAQWRADKSSAEDAEERLMKIKMRGTVHEPVSLSQSRRRAQIGPRTLDAVSRLKKLKRPVS